MNKTKVGPDSAPSHSSVLLIGPDPNVVKQGRGVSQHMKLLSQILPALVTIQVFDPGSTSGKFSAALPRIVASCLKLRKIVVKAGYNHVWINSSIYPTAVIKLLILLWSLRSIPHPTVRVFFHGGRFEKIGFLRTLPINKLAKRLLRRADSVHFLSRQQGKGFEDTFPGFSWVPYSNFLSSDLTLTRQPDKKKAILFVGRLIPEKGVRELMAAFDLLSRDKLGNDLVLWFAGDGPEMDSLYRETQCRQDNAIRLWGHLDRTALEALYSKAFLLVLPSYWDEGFPYVIIEAMQAGLPIIATPNGVIPDIVREGVNGFLIPPQDPDVLVSTISQLLRDPDLWNAMSNNNKELFKQSLSETAAKNYYRSLLSSAPLITNA